jgi:YVTN family beta-propeller protein
MAHIGSANHLQSRRSVRMKQKVILPFFSILLLFVAVTAAVPVQSSTDYRTAAPDQPGEDENINKELWQFGKNTPYTEAMQHIAGQKMANHAVPTAEVRLPTGWRIAPAGRQVGVGTFPHEAIAYAGQVVVLNSGYTDRKGKEPQEVSIVNPDTGKVVKLLRVASLFPSAVAGKDGDLYISGGSSRKILRFDRKLKLVREYTVGKNTEEGYTAGLASIDGTHIAVVCMVSSATVQDFDKGIYQQGKLLIVNTSTGDVERETTAGYFPHTVRFQKGKLYVTLLGENKLLVYDLRLNLIKSLMTGRTPQDICYGDDRLYVVNTGSDNVSVVDPKKDSIIASIDLQSRGKGFGSAPTSCAVDGHVLYVTQATTNSVALFDTKRGRLKGFIPSGWYPTKVLIEGKHLLVLNGKGIQARRPNIDGPQPVPGKGGDQYVLTLLKGSLSIIPAAQISRNLTDWTRRVQDGSPVYSPLKGFKIPVRHIFYIIRENRTYDQVLGDLKKGNGDPFLTLFGQQVTPNAHKLADEFVTLDNFYANGEISVLGHSFTTSGYASPFLEWLGNAAYSGRYKGYPFGIVPSTTSPAYLWDAMEDRGIDYRIYGEDYYIYTRAYRITCDAYGPDSMLARKFYKQMMSLASNADRGATFYRFAQPYYGQADTPEKAMRLLEKPDFVKLLSEFFCGDESLADAIRDNAPFRLKFAEFLCRYPFNYRSWDLKHSDIERAKEWKIDFDAQLRSGKVARLQYIWLPNDHTAGTDKDNLAPDQLVAQNDAALGLIIESIAKSPVWKESLILVTEDDAQNGPDHVDATRTVALAAGPYVKRGLLINDRYDQLSMLRTIEILLNMPPINMNDALAAPMFGIFTEKPDVRSYSAAQPPEKLTDSDKILYRNFVRSHFLSSKIQNRQDLHKTSPGL